MSNNVTYSKESCGCDQMNEGQKCSQCQDKRRRDPDPDYGRARADCPQPIMDACIYAKLDIDIVAGEFEVKLRQGNLPPNTCLGEKLIITANRGHGYYLVEASDAKWHNTKIPCTECLVPGPYKPTRLVDTSRKLCEPFKIPEVADPEAENPPTSILTVDKGGFAPGDLAILSDGTGYIVKKLVASTQGFAYSVCNTAGIGGEPGDTVYPWGDKEPCGEKNITVERVQQNSICPVGESRVACHFLYCPDGQNTTRAFVPGREGEVPYGTKDGKWEGRIGPNPKCCLVTTGCLKFITKGGLIQKDEVAVQSDTDISCFAAYVDGLQSQGKQPIAIVNGTDKYAVLAFGKDDDGVDQICLKVTGKDTINVEYPVGTSICIAECCEGCFSAVSQTDFDLGDLSDPNVVPNLFINPIGNFDLTDEDSQTFVMGFDPDIGVSTILECNQANVDSGAINIQDAKFVSPTPALRSKYCPNSCCAEDHKFLYNYKLRTDLLPEGIGIEYQICSRVWTSETLCDDTEPSPTTEFNSSSLTQIDLEHCGPSENRTTEKVSSLNGVYPISSGTFFDFGKTDQNFCLDAEIYLTARVYKKDPAAPDTGDFQALFEIRRVIESKPRSDRALPPIVTSF